MNGSGRTLGALLLGGSLAFTASATAGPPWAQGLPWWMAPMKLSTVERENMVEGENNVGLATLVRTRSAVHVRISTTALEPHSAYTVWVAAFNQPANCVDGCNGEDLPAADGSVFWGTAFVTGEGGTANVDFDVEAGGLPFGTYVFNGHSGGIRWMNGLNVELHLILSHHGPSDEIADFADKLNVPGALPGEQVALFK